MALALASALYCSQFIAVDGLNCLDVPVVGGGDKRAAAEVAGEVDLRMGRVLNSE